MPKRKFDEDGLDRAINKKKKQKPKKSFNPKFDKVISTGSTLLDLAISGKRVRGGGVCGGVILEAFGPSQCGKTSILAELIASCKARGGEADIRDPEARLDVDYCRTYGLNRDDYDYSKPDTVTEAFDFKKWKPNTDNINVRACDSLAALSTDLEMEKGDKMGMRRAKEFSQELRKNCRLIEKNNWVIACSNQLRQGDFGDVTPGGKGIPYYASIRIKMKQIKKIEKEKTLKSKVKVKKIVGIITECEVIKSVDEPYRKANIYIMFNYGVDDIRANLQYLKDMNKTTTYKIGDKSYVSLDQAVAYVEKNKLARKLKKEVIDLWEVIEAKFDTGRPKKKRN